MNNNSLDNNSLDNNSLDNNSLDNNINIVKWIDTHNTNKEAIVSSDTIYKNQVFNIEYNNTEYNMIISTKINNKYYNTEKYSDEFGVATVIDEK